MKLRRLFGRDDDPQEDPVDEVTTAGTPAEGDDDPDPLDAGPDTDDGDEDGGDAEAAGGPAGEALGADDEVEGPDAAAGDALAAPPADPVAPLDPGPAPSEAPLGGADDGGAADGEGPGDGAGDEGAGDPDEAEERAGQVAFELADWGARERKLIDEALTAVRVRRAWEAGTLVVAAGDADVVDDLIDEIEERVALDLAPGVKPVIYDVGDWPVGLEDRFLEALIDQRVPHNRGYREIVVGVDDEERVDAMVEEVTAAWEDEAPTEEELDGPDAQEVLSELFVSADRLMHDPSDRTGTVRFDDAATSATEMSLPFGFDSGDWTAITAQVTVLRDLLGEPETTDDEIVEAATGLRTLLRPLV